MTYQMVCPECDRNIDITETVVKGKDIVVRGFCVEDGEVELCE